MTKESPDTAQCPLCRKLPPAELSLEKGVTSYCFGFVICKMGKTVQFPDWHLKALFEWGVDNGYGIVLKTSKCFSNIKELFWQTSPTSIFNRKANIAPLSYHPSPDSPMGPICFWRSGRGLECEIVHQHDCGGGCHRGPQMNTSLAQSWT